MTSVHRIKARFKIKRKPGTSGWKDAYVWEPDDEARAADYAAWMASVEEHIEAEALAPFEDDLSEWDDCFPNAPFEPVAIVPKREDKSIQALTTIAKLRDEAGLVRSVINPVLAEALAQGLLTW